MHAECLLLESGALGGGAVAGAAGVEFAAAADAGRAFDGVGAGAGVDGWVGALVPEVALCVVPGLVVVLRVRFTVVFRAGLFLFFIVAVAIVAVVGVVVGVGTVISTRVRART